MKIYSLEYLVEGCKSTLDPAGDVDELSIDASGVRPYGRAATSQEQ